MWISSQLGIDPWGRIGTGIRELVAAVLLVFLATVIFGTGLAAGLMVGAVFSHLTRLGIVVQDDGGLLFSLALTVLACLSGVLVLRRKEIPIAHRLQPAGRR